jgi:1,4-dihydroxy-2-naphthoate octaprenyltransferase
MVKFLNIFITLRCHIVFLYFSVFIFVAKALDAKLSAAEWETGLIFAFLVQLAYVYSKTLDYDEDVANNEEVFSFAFYKKLRYVSYGLIGILIFYLAFKYTQLLPIFIYGAISIIPYSSKSFKFKGHFIVKPIINVIGFFLMAVMTPVLLSDPSAYDYIGLVFANSIELVAIIFCITLMFDVRDIQGDIKAGLKTVPVILGKTVTLLFLSGIVLVFAFLNFKKGEMSSLINDLIVMIFIFGGFKAKSKIYFASIVFIEIIFIWVLIWLK